MIDPNSSDAASATLKPLLTEPPVGGAPVLEQLLPTAGAPVVGKTKQEQVRDIVAQRNAASAEAQQLRMDLAAKEALLQSLEEKPAIPLKIVEQLKTLGYNDPPDAALLRVITDFQENRKTLELRTAALTDADILRSPIWESEVVKPQQEASDRISNSLAEVRLVAGVAQVSNQGFIDKALAMLDGLKDYSPLTVRAALNTAAEELQLPLPSGATVAEVSSAIAEIIKIQAKGVEMRQNWYATKEQRRVATLQESARQRTEATQKIESTIRVLCGSVHLGDAYAPFNEWIPEARLKAEQAMLGVVSRAQTGDATYEDAAAVHLKAQLFDALMPDILLAQKAKVARAIQGEVQRPPVIKAATPEVLASQGIWNPILTIPRSS